MADNKFGASMEAMFSGMDKVLSSKTVVGETIKVNENTYVMPLVDVSFGLGAGANINEHSNKNFGGGGMGAKLNPSAVLVVTDGVARVMSIKEQDRLIHLVESVPDMVSAVMSLLKKSDKSVDEAVESAFDNMEV